MRGTRFLLSAGAAAVVFAGGASADVVKLRNGDSLEGRATDLGESVQVVCGERTVELSWSRVSVIERASDSTCCKDAPPCCKPSTSSKAETADTAKAEDAGWKKAAADLEARGFIARDGKWLLKEEADALDRRAALARAASDEEKRAAKLLESLGDRNPSVRSFASESMASVDADLRRRTFLVGSRHRNAAVRAASAAGLGKRGDEGVVRTLLQLAVKDSAPEVRAAAVASLKTVALPEVAAPLTRCLDSENVAVRMNAAMALGELGSRTSVETLIRRVHWVAGPSNRANLQVLNQVSYISDYDVEIAQLAQIGDPIVSQLREGVVLDVKVFAAEGIDVEVERRAYTRALTAITGKDLGPDAKAWAKWWVDEGKVAMLGEATAK
jgi:hypothetical protein